MALELPTCLLILTFVFAVLPHLHFSPHLSPSLFLQFVLSVLSESKYCSFPLKCGEQRFEKGRVQQRHLGEFQPQEFIYFVRKKYDTVKHHSDHNTSDKWILTEKLSKKDVQLNHPWKCANEDERYFISSAQSFNTPTGMLSRTSVSRALTPETDLVWMIGEMSLSQVCAHC